MKPDYVATMHQITLEPMKISDIEYLYELCEQTMRSYVEQVWGNWNEIESRRALAEALARGEFCTILNFDSRVGAISVVKHPACHQLEQLYIEPACQNMGIGSLLVRSVL